MPSSSGVRVVAMFEAAKGGLVLLAGCGYRPLYGSSSDGRDVVSAFADVTVEQQKTRTGQLIRNDLLSSLTGAQSGAAYVVRLEPSEKTSVVSTIVGQKITRRRLGLTVKYVLANTKDGSTVTEGSSFSQVSYDTVKEPIADLQAAENARDRATREVAEDIRLRLAAFLASRRS